MIFIICIFIYFFSINRGTDEDYLPPSEHTFEVQVEKDNKKVSGAGFESLETGSPTFKLGLPWFFLPFSTKNKVHYIEWKIYIQVLHFCVLKQIKG